METIIAFLMIAFLLCAAIIYLIKQKKKGTACVGCPHAGKCAHHCKSNPSVTSCRDHQN